MSRSFGISEQVEAYIRAANRREPPALARCREETQRNAEQPAMQISPEQGAFQALMARLIGAKTYYEIGVFTGYSMLATALAMKDYAGSSARCVGFDVSEEFVSKARDFWDEAGVSSMIDMRIGPAVETLRETPEASADLIFVDADKTGYPDYFRAAERLLRPGGLVMFDNVLWDGDVADPDKAGEDVRALRAVAEMARESDAFDIAFTTIGDGLLLCQRR